jgi:prepilin-type N-terminal cleavage/methylation domain-containing protein
MTKTTNHKAFSLIEISVVIVIIGILIAGISSGIELYDDYKLKVAQNLTKNSRVARIKDLELWFETTSENSLATGTATFVDKANPTNGNSISRWNDINPNILPTARNNATQTNEANQPKYIRNGMNGLSTLLFDGIDDSFSYNGNFLVGSDYTIFVVEARNFKEFDHFCQNMSKTIPAYSSTIARIHSFTFASALGKSIYTNGAGLISNSDQANKNPLSGYPSSRIGGGGYKGSIAEIIFYSRALTNLERQGVEAYLSKNGALNWGKYFFENALEIRVKKNGLNRYF